MFPIMNEPDPDDHIQVIHRKFENFNDQYEFACSVKLFCMSLAVSWLKLHAYVMLIAQWAQYTAISHHCTCLSVI